MEMSSGQNKINYSSSCSLMVAYEINSYSWSIQELQLGLQLCHQTYITAHLAQTSLSVVGLQQQCQIVNLMTCATDVWYVTGYD